MTVGLSPVAGAGWQFFDANGVPLSGGKLYTYVAGTTTPQATYTSSSGLTPNANPIILNSEGRVSGTNEVWLDSAVSYKLILQTSASVQLWSADDLSGITGVPSNTAYAVLCGGTTATNPIQSIASVGTAGQVLTSNGASALPTMQAAFISGMIILWSGSVVSIPAGWLLCNGASSTPDLRDRFVVGAGSTYAVDATGGSADATLPTHTHTATSLQTLVTHTLFKLAEVVLETQAAQMRGRLLLQQTLLLLELLLPQVFLRKVHLPPMQTYRRITRFATL
jgi:hypothetical protein